MTRVVVRRLASLLPLLLLVSAGAFLLLDAAPIDAANTVAGENATPQEIQATRERLGLDDPVAVRYTRWLGDVVHGDLGESTSTSEPVSSLLVDRLGVTTWLLVVSMTITVVVGLGGGFAAVLWPRSIVRRLISATSVVAVAVPQFWLGLVLVGLFAVDRSWFPATGYVDLADDPWQWLRHLLLPALALAAVPTATLVRQFHAALDSAMHTDFVITALAKGLPRWLAAVKHAGKVAAGTAITVCGIQVSRILGGTIIVEQIFALRGLGALATNSVFTRDMPVVLGVVIVMTIAVLATNFGVDVAHGYLNPRTRAR